jgi:hypothetical protein
VEGNEEVNKRGAEGTRDDDEGGLDVGRRLTNNDQELDLMSATTSRISRYKRINLVLQEVKFLERLRRTCPRLYTQYEPRSNKQVRTGESFR